MRFAVILIALTLVYTATADLTPQDRGLEEFRAKLRELYDTRKGLSHDKLTPGSCKAWGAIFSDLGKLEDEYMDKWNDSEPSPEQKEQEESAIKEWETLRGESISMVFQCGETVTQTAEFYPGKETATIFNAKGQKIELTGVPPKYEYRVTDPVTETPSPSGSPLLPSDPFALNFRIFDKPPVDPPADGWQRFGNSIAPYGGEYNNNSLPYYIQFCHVGYLPEPCRHTTTECLFMNVHDPAVRADCYARSIAAGPKCIYWHECIRGANRYLDTKYGRPVEYPERVEIAYQMKNDLLDELSKDALRMAERIKTEVSGDTRAFEERVELLMQRVNRQRDLATDARESAVKELSQINDEHKEVAKATKETIDRIHNLNNDALQELSETNDVTGRMIREQLEYLKGRAKVWDNISAALNSSAPLHPDMPDAA